MLEVADLRAGYGPVTVLRGVTISVADKAIVGLLGANGAGKTTLMLAICGLATIQDGDVRFAGRETTGSEPETLVRRGLVYVPEGRRLFSEMTVRENLEMGGYVIGNTSERRGRIDRMQQLFPILRERAGQAAGSLSGGEQQMLALARALMSRPRCLLLDEPSLGLAPKVVDSILAIVREINAEGTAVLVAEQNARKLLRVAHYCYVLENGRVALEGESNALLADDRIHAAYFGTS
jgi:branched-chain amino acid transport system ATP-binding protein